MERQNYEKFAVLMQASR